MHYSELHDIKFGELVAFGNADNIIKLFSLLRDKTHHPLSGDISGYSVRTEQTSNPHLKGLAVVRRPLVLYPEQCAYVATPIINFEENIDELRRCIADCIADSAPHFELLRRRDDFDRGEVCACIKSSLQPTPGSESNFYDQDLCMLRESLEVSMPCSPIEVDEGAYVDVDEDDIDCDLNFDHKKWLDKLSALVLEYVTANHSMPPQELINTVIAGKLQISDNNVLSPIVVNGDMRIILPAYNELELRMTPLARTVYILFLCHPEGIVLKNINDYREQLRDIYLLVKPGADSRLAEEYINELTYPGSDSLQQKLSLIKRSINRYLLRKNIAEAYYISGSRGKAYKISGIAPSQITLPRALRP